MALEIASSFQPQVCLLDIGLPGINGYDVARKLRSGSRSGKVLLIAGTGYGQHEDRRRAMEAGFDRYITKPLSANAFAQLLVRAEKKGT